MTARALAFTMAAMACTACGAPTLDVGTPFTVAHTGPSHGATGIAVDTDVRVGFSDPIDEQSARDNHGLLIDGEAVDHSVLFFENATVLVLVPSRTLPADTLVHVDVGADVQSASGVDLDSPLVIEFTTAP